MSQTSGVTPAETHNAKEFLKSLGLTTLPKTERWMRRNKINANHGRVGHAKGIVFARTRRTIR